MKREEFELIGLNLKGLEAEISFSVNGFERVITAGVDSESGIVKAMKDAAFWCASTGGYIPMGKLAEMLDSNVSEIAGMNLYDYDLKRMIQDVDVENVKNVINPTTIAINNGAWVVQFSYEYRSLFGKGMEKRKSARIPFSGNAYGNAALFPFVTELYDFLCHVEDVCYDAVLSIMLYDSRRIKQLGLFEQSGIDGATKIVQIRDLAKEAAAHG